MPHAPLQAPISVLGRYAIYEAIAAGGMARVYLGRQLGAAGFARTVAVKRMLPHLVEDQRFVTMFIDEARLAARIRHPNVVTILDVVTDGAELFLVMEYVAGESLATLQRVLHRGGVRVPPEIASSLVAGVLYGLHAAHEAVSEDGSPLDLVHRDVSPPNILIGADGITRVLDFGVAKAVGRLQQTTQRGQFKGKLGYVAPEQLQTTGAVTRHADIYAAGVVLWELLAGRRLIIADNQGAALMQILDGNIPLLAEVAPWVDAAAREVVDRAMARAPEARYPTALEMATALERVIPPASPGRVAAWLQEVAHEALGARAAVVARVERAPLPPDLEEAARIPQAALSSEPPAPQPQPQPPPRPKPRAWLFLVLGSALAAVIVALALGLGQRAPGGERLVLQPAPPARLAAPDPPSEATPPSPQGQPTAAPEADRGPGAGVAAAGDRGDLAREDTAAPDGGTLDAGAATAPSPAASRPKNPCDPPYYIDKDGIQRVKRYCYPR